MLNVPNLDDQRFEEILENAVNGIPYLYDQWTDFNAHDPGITLLELFGWYKQMQQYHLNRVTDRHKRMLLKLLGLSPEGLRETQTMVQFSEEMRGRRFPKGMRLYSEGGVTFEFSDTVTAGGILFREAYILRGDDLHDVTSVLTQKQVPLKMNEGDVLYLGFDGLENRESFRLWFDTDDSYPVHRNHFEDGALLPRTIRLEAIGDAGPAAIEIIRDETFALSFSGALALSCRNGIPLTDGGRGLPVLSWLTLRMTEHGCEEEPAILNVTADFAATRQRTTNSEVNEYTANEYKVTLELDSWLAVHGKTDIFVRDEQGWYEIKPEQLDVLTKDEVKLLHLELRPQTLVFDGAPNVRIICCEESFRTVMRKSSTGLPNQQVRLLLNSGEQPITEELRLMCRSGEGHTARFHDWHYVASLEDASAGERAFIYDENLGLVFGDNDNGAVPEAGKNSIYLAGFALSEGGEGGITDGQELFAAGAVAPCDEPERPGGQIAVGSAFDVRMGRDCETIESAVLRMESSWRGGRTATAADFEKVALKTPGRRVAQAKALPLYEPDSIIQSDVPGMLTLVVLPYSENQFPMPDKHFLESVRRHVEKYRVICTKVQVIAPEYVKVNIRADIIADADEQAVYRKVSRALEDYFSLDSSRELGALVSQSGVLGAIGGVDSVLGVTDIHIGADGNRFKYNKHGDVIIHKHGIAYLGTLELRVSQQ